jgi:hypothetical protein
MGEAGSRAIPQSLLCPNAILCPSSLPALLCLTTLRAGGFGSDSTYTGRYRLLYVLPIAMIKHKITIRLVTLEARMSE